MTEKRTYSDYDLHEVQDAVDFVESMTGEPMSEEDKARLASVKTRKDADEACEEVAAKYGPTPAMLEQLNGRFWRRTRD